MKPIFQIHQCLSEENIKGYLTNRLSEEERFRVENHLLDCPLCSDAVDGYAAMEVDQSAGKGVGQQAVRLQMSNWRFFGGSCHPCFDCSGNLDISQTAFYRKAFCRLLHLL